MRGGQCSRSTPSPGRRWLGWSLLGVLVLALLGAALASNQWLASPAPDTRRDTGLEPSRLAGSTRQTDLGQNANPHSANRKHSGMPLSIKPTAAGRLSDDASLRQATQKAIRTAPAVPGYTTTVCHILRMHHDSQFGRALFPNTKQCMQLLTDSNHTRQRLKGTLLLETAHGLRYKPGWKDKWNKGESHADYVLATFAQIGVPLSKPIRHAGTQYEVRDLLNDTVAGFSLDQPEIAWTAISLALYRAEAGSWQNSDGQTFTFDQLAKELLSRDLDKASCGGTHLLHAMSLLLRADAKTSCLGADVRKELRMTLAGTVKTATQTQADQGYWAPDWQNPGDTPSDGEEKDDRLLITGHAVEWMIYLPTKLQPGKQVYRRAANWLRTELADTPRQLTASEYCHYTHALRSLRILAGLG